MFIFVSAISTMSLTNAAQKTSNARQKTSTSKVTPPAAPQPAGFCQPPGNKC
jgi:hypothetical protein